MGTLDWIIRIDFARNRGSAIYPLLFPKPYTVDPTVDDHALRLQKPARGHTALSPRAELVLASASPARATMLSNAGIAFIREPASVDEGRIKAERRSHGSDARHTALALAEGKATEVAKRRRGATVIGSDQMLECDGVWFDKPTDRAGAVKTLQNLRGRGHKLVSAVVVMRDDLCLWRFVDVARLTMRPFSDGFLRRYVDQAGDGILSSVGAYRLEGPGVQLFSRIEGDYFTVLGMPLLPLLDLLRRENVLES